MNKQIRYQIINLAQTIFDDSEFSIVMNLLNMNQLNKLRMYVAEKIDLLEAIYELDNDNEVLFAQINFCDELENIVMETYLETV